MRPSAASAAAHALAWPFAAWVAALAGLVATAAATGHGPFDAGTWAHWDSAHYLAIARHGYSDFHPCEGGHWCGDAAWFPGYPLLMAALHGVGLPLAGAAVALSWAFTFAAIVVLWVTFLRELPRVAALGGLAFAAWTPGQVFDYALFPLSMLFFFTALTLRFLVHARPLAAGLAAAAAVLSHPVGITLALVGTIWLAAVSSRDRLRAIGLFAVPSLLAFFLILAVQRAQTGRWSAFFDVQSRYGHGIHDPFGVASNAILLLARTPSFLTRENAPPLQMVLVCAVLLAVVAQTALRRRGSQVDLLLVVWALVTWAFPLTQANVSYWRSEAALAPLAILVARLPRAVLVPAVAAFVVVSVPLAWLFFDNRLT